MPRKIIVDCDPGHDDAIALLIAHGSPEIELLAITTVMGLPTRALDPRHAVDLIIETLLHEPPGPVTLVPTAALTNIAMAVRKEPRIVERVAEVVLMGGAVAGGNRTAAAESNIVTDPEAAHIVFGERWPVTMVGLELTVQAVATPDVVDRSQASGPPRPATCWRCWSSSAAPTSPSRAFRTRRCTTCARWHG